MTAETRRPRTDAEKAVLCVLRRAAEDTHGLGRFIGEGANTFELLCAAEAAYTSETASEVAARYGRRPYRSTDDRPVTRVTFDVELNEEDTQIALSHACDVIEDEDLSTDGEPTAEDLAAMTFCRALANATVELQ